MYLRNGQVTTFGGRSTIYFAVDSTLNNSSRLRYIPQSDARIRKTYFIPGKCFLFRNLRHFCFKSGFFPRNNYFEDCCFFPVLSLYCATTIDVRLTISRFSFLFQQLQLLKVTNSTIRTEFSLQTELTYQQAIGIQDTKFCLY